MSRLRNKKILLSLILSSILGVFSVYAWEANASSGSADYGSPQGKNAFVVDKDGVLTRYNGLGAEVVVPEGVKSLGMKVFSDHPEIESIILPRSLISIDRYVFSDCIGLISISIPENTQEIGSLAFSNCVNLKKVYIGKNVDKIGRLAFWGCESLEKIEVNGNNKTFASNGGVIFSKDMKALIHFPAGTEGVYEVPDGVEKICGYSFFGCKRLQGVIFPESLKYIRDTAFYGCCELKSVKFSKNLESIGACSFADCINLESAELYESLKSIGSNAFFNCLSLKDITIRSKEFDIGYRVFGSCKNIIIYGYEDSVVKTYAEKNKITFISL